MLIDHMSGKHQIQASQSGNCVDCTHPTKTCSGSCQNCLHEVHFEDGDDKRRKYDCKKLVESYWCSFVERYYQNIKAACQNIDFSQYSYIGILSLGCGASPDLMAFEEIADGKTLKYHGIDSENHWTSMHDEIIDYSQNISDMFVDYEERNVFEEAATPPTEIYNVVILQFFISSLCNDGKKETDIITLFRSIVESAVSRWNDSDIASPFLFVLNDVDSMNEGRGCFYRLIDLLEEQGYAGVAYAYSAYRTNSDLGEERWSKRKNSAEFGNITYKYSSRTSNNSATLVIEVTKKNDN